MEVLHTRSTSTRAPAVWRWLLAAHLFAFVSGLAANALLAACAAASLSLFTAVWYGVKHNQLSALSLVLANVAGNVFSHAFANLVWVEFATTPPGIYPELTGWLAALLCWCTVAGAFIMHLVLGREPLFDNVPVLQKWQTLAVASVIFAALAVMFVLGGELDGRWNSAATSTSGIRYFAYAIGSITYVFFFILGIRLRGSLLEPRNLLTLGFVGAIAAAQGFSGGREYSLIMGLCVLLGAGYSALSRRSLLVLGAAMGCAGMLFVVVVGIARANPHFAFGSVDDRVDSIREASHSLEDDSADESPIAAFAQRIFEMSTQVVIDQTELTGQFAGFENFDRLAYIFTPKIIMRDRPEVDDSKEVLIRDFGYQLSENTGVPIPLLADAYRRGGALWVAMAGLFIGLWLRLLVRITLVVSRREVGLVVLAMLAVICLRSYVWSALGTIGLLTYTWLKCTLLVAGFFWIARILTFVTETSTLGASTNQRVRSET